MTNGNTIEIIEQFFAGGELPSEISKRDLILLHAIKQVRTEMVGGFKGQTKDTKALGDFTWGENKDPRDEKSLSFQVQRNSRVIKVALWAGGIVVVAILGAIGSTIAGGIGI